MADSKTDCEHYQPGDVMGNERPVCRYYRKSGVCTSGKEFMCKFWVEKWLNEHPVKGE
jgi:hypothetical protein